MAVRKKPAERYHHGNLRSALLETAWTFVSRHGAEALSLRALAEALGVSHAAPAWHFKDKAALVEALRVEGWTRFADALERGRRDSSDSLRGTGRAYLDFALRHPRQMELMFRAGSPPHDELMQQGGRAWTTLTTAVAETIGPRRAADPAELSAMALAAWSMTHGLASLLTEVPLPVDVSAPGARDALVEKVLAVALNGIEKSPAAPRRRS